MSNHIHLIAVPDRSCAMSSTLGRGHANYARHFNLKKRACGHVWQSRYFSTPLDTKHLWHALAYVERSPVRAGLVQDAEAYPWASTRERLALAANAMVDLTGWAQEYTKERWKQVLRRAWPRKPLDSDCRNRAAMGGRWKTRLCAGLGEAKRTGATSFAGGSA